MKVIYTAGPIRDKRGNWHIKKNLDKAEEVAYKLWKMGHAVICPQLNSAWMDSDDLDHHSFMAGDLEIISRCDAVVLLPGWRMSEGAVEEYEVAKKRGIKVFMWPSDESFIKRFGREGLSEVERRRHTNGDCDKRSSRDTEDSWVEELRQMHQRKLRTDSEIDWVRYSRRMPEMWKGV